MFYRRIIHFGFHLTIAILAGFLSQLIAALISAGFAVHAGWNELPANKPTALKKTIERFGKTAVKPFEKYQISSATWSFFSLTILSGCCWLFQIPGEFASLGIAILAICDPAAGWLRHRLSGPIKEPWRRVAGSFLFFGVAVLLLWLAKPLHRHIIGEHADIEIWLIIVIAAVPTVVELCAVRYIDDNGIIPASTVLALLLAGDFSQRQLFAVGTVCVVLIFGMAVVNGMMNRCAIRENSNLSKQPAVDGTADEVIQP